MDFNFADLKKEAAATADDIFGHAADAVKQASSATSDLLSTSSSSALSAGHEDNNAHTEQYFANDQRDLDFEQVDPQKFVQRMSAGAKEAQEQLDAKFSQHASNYDDIMNMGRDFGAYTGKVQQEATQGVAALTNDFMNMERSFFSGVGDPKSAPAVKPAASTFEGDLLGDVGFGDNKFAPTAPAAPNSQFYDDNFSSSPLTKSSASNKDSDTDSPSISYNPSPAKKAPVADALKEQDNEQFISSEDLLSDFKEERTATPDLKAAAVKVTPPAPVPVPTTDLDADDDDFLLGSKHTAKAAATSQVENLTAAHKAPAPAPAPAAAPKSAPPPPPQTPAAAAKPAPKPPAVVAEPVKPQPTPSVKSTPSVTSVTADAKKSEPQEHKDQPNILSVQEIFYKYGLDAWFKPERLHPRVESLIYWRDVKKSGIVFGAGLIIFLAISCFSVISVFAYLSLITLAGTIAFRIYKSVMQAIQKTTDGHPYKEFLEYDLTLSQEKIQNIVGIAVAHVNGFTAELRRLFLVEDLVDSIKFGVILWVLTYIGAWFNGMTLVILAYVSLFTLPKVYENNKQSIDTYLELVQSKFTEITEKIRAAIPIGNKKPITTESDKDK